MECGQISDRLISSLRFRFDVNSGKWTELAAMNTERSFFATAVLHEKIIASGGIDKYQLDSVEYYDPQKNQWQLIAPMNRKRSEHSLAVHNDHIYAVGGRDEDSIEYYDCFINKWTLVNMKSYFYTQKL